MSSLGRRRPGGAAGMIFILLALAGPAAPCAEPPTLPEGTRERVVAAVESVLSGRWTITEVTPNEVPADWDGPAECLYVRLEDLSLSFPHATHDFMYHPFYKLWILPLRWEGRMAVSEIQPNALSAVYLGENSDFRVLYRSLGRNTWPNGPEALAEALGLCAFPLTHRPLHTLDVDAMQRLLQRLDNGSEESLDRWLNQLYGIAELPGIIYLELLTWEDRKGRAANDPYFLGNLAEKETRYLAQQVLAAFPGKSALYLRRVTRDKFSDVLVVNPASYALAP